MAVLTSEIKISILKWYSECWRSKLHLEMDIYRYVLYIHTYMYVRKCDKKLSPLMKLPY